jgi:RNA polymerase sigma factor (sigma-70 family)
VESIQNAGSTTTATVSTDTLSCALGILRWPKTLCRRRFAQRFVDQIRDFSKIKHWLFTTLRRHFLLRIRRHKKYPEVRFLTDIHDFPAQDPEVWRSLDARSVQEALLQVDERYRVALELFYLNNLSYKEIVDTLRIPIGTVMSRLSRGKAQLKSILSTSFYGDGRMQRMRGSDIPKR